MAIKGKKQTLEHVRSRVKTRICNGSYKINSGSFKLGHVQRGGEETRFKKGMIPWNKGIRKYLDINNIKKEYISGKSTNDLEKEFGVSAKTISNRLRENGFKLRPKHSKCTELVKQKIRASRAKQVFPLKDSSIEVKIQNFLKELEIEFYTHQYMDIPHGYQCDIFIPSKNCVIECFGTYWHKYPTGREIDSERYRELMEKGYRVLVLWENEIKFMKKEDLSGRLDFGREEFEN